MNEQVNETRPGEREGIVGSASSAGRVSFKRLWSRRRGRERRESELKRG